MFPYGYSFAGLPGGVFSSVFGMMFLYATVDRGEKRRLRQVIISICSGLVFPLPILLLLGIHGIEGFDRDALLEVAEDGSFLVFLGVLYIVFIMPFVRSFFARYREKTPLSEKLGRRRILLLVVNLVLVGLIVACGISYVEFYDVSKEADFILSDADKIYIYTSTAAMLPTLVFYYHLMTVLGWLFGALVFHFQEFLDEVLKRIRPFAGTLALFFFGQGLLILFFATLYGLANGVFGVFSTDNIAPEFGTYLELAANGMALQGSKLSESLNGSGKVIFAFQSVVGLIWIVVVLGLIIDTKRDTDIGLARGGSVAGNDRAELPDGPVEAAK